MNKTVKLTLFLAIISALATGVLAAVNSVTAPIIAANEAGAQTAEIEKLYPNASSFEAVEFEADADGLVREAYKVDEDAYVFQVAARGYDDDIVFLIGYDVDGSNSKFQILSNNDTPGFGQRLMEDEYHQGMTGKSTSDPVDMISGVTASSDAIKNGVDAAVTVFNSLTGSTATPEEVEKLGVETKTVQCEYEKGMNVKIIDGAMSGFTGEITDITADKQRLKLVVSMFGRETSVELNVSQVSPLE